MTSPFVAMATRGLNQGGNSGKRGLTNSNRTDIFIVAHEWYWKKGVVMYTQFILHLDSVFPPLARNFYKFLPVSSVPFQHPDGGLFHGVDNSICLRYLGSGMYAIFN
ncbi:hypothetical protein CEXT_721071 [Caerostris extrusa]|uniref:Uncharacterized protein n=1 Tax=Caerostris extrusa TaxID=172846 RepID=A0AAV4MXA5_CAEEX|nr:hypothetical protein CEXT_721071 [Caerostris extrusa]